MSKIKFLFASVFFVSVNAFAGDADIQLPSLDQVNFFHGAVTSRAILFFGLFVCAVGAAFGLWQDRTFDVDSHIRELRKDRNVC